MHNKNTVILTFIAFATIVVLCTVIYYWLRKKSTKTKLLPFLISTLAMLTFEAVKQIYGIATGGYDLFWLPLHICTIAIIGFVLVSLLNQNSVYTKVLWSLSLTAGFMVSIAMIVAPWPIIGYAVDHIFEGTASYIDYYSVFVHYLFALLFVLGVVLQPYKPVFKDFFVSLAIWAMSLWVIVVVATLTQVNYAMFLDFKLPWLLDMQEKYFTFFQCLLFACYVGVYFVIGILLCFSSKLWYKVDMAKLQESNERQEYAKILSNII